MGRFETLNADTQDLVNCLLPALATSFGVEDAVEIIPEDIRMRAWDCDRRDHIKDQTENDPRNWGVQFLKDLMAICRIKKGNLDVFQADLRAKVAKHEEKHPWCRLNDIREIKDEYEHPDRKPPPVQEPSEESSTDSYLEELHEPDLPPGMKRGRSRHEIYEARVQPKRRKIARLRRSENGGYERKEKPKRHGGNARQRDVSVSSRPSVRRASRVVDSDGEDAHGSSYTMAYHPQGHHTPSFSMSPVPDRMPSAVPSSIAHSDQPIEVQKLAAELEVAEAELKAARIRMAYTQALEKQQREKEMEAAQDGDLDFE
ncbi:hypothetical protein ACEQ8H_000119 [Pleosporales sp. CAS-2024a]